MIIQIKEYATRIDVYLTKILGEKSRSSIVQSIEEGKILINGKRVKKNYKIHFGDILEIIEERENILDLKEKMKDMFLEIVYEDEFLAIVNKPRGLLMYSVKPVKEVTLAQLVRNALPLFVSSATMTALTVVALVLNSPLLATPLLVSAVLLAIGLRGYLKHATAGYIAEQASYSQINATINETVEGARCVEALGLAESRQQRLIDDVAESAQAERYTMSLRNLLFVWMSFAYQLPLALVVLVGVWGYRQGLVGVGQITAAAIYCQQLIGSLDRVIETLDYFQVGLAGTTRLLGIAIEIGRASCRERV